MGIDVDHSIINNEYMQFVINENDIVKLEGRIDYDIIHNNVEEFYQSRLIQNYSSRDFNYGSMGGYYTFDEIEENLDELTDLYPNIFTEKFSIGTSLEGRNIWGIKISDNPNIDEDEPEKLIISALSLFSANSKDNFVLVLFSKKRFAMVISLKLGTFLIGLLRTSLK